MKTGVGVVGLVVVAVVVFAGQRNSMDGSCIRMRFQPQVLLDRLGVRKGLLDW